jgi:YggT family protein
MTSLILLVNIILEIYTWLLIAWVVVSWLVAFDVINTRNRFVYMVRDFLYRITEPVLRPIRRLVPNIGGIDVSPVVLLLAIWLIRDLMFRYLL